MPFSIQTNVNSLVAQENLRVNSNFQSQTIQRLTSGYRINSSGDDAAGLAVANKFRSDVSEITQGVRNANDGVSQLQIVDSGMNNVSKMLDRLRTLATQSASSTFTGDRGVLNSEFQSLLTEIDRQAQSIGLNQNGSFAKSLSVYIGGGRAAATSSLDTTNGTVTVDLRASTVDTTSLGLKGTQVKGNVTNVGSAVNESANLTSGNKVADFYFAGPGFSDGSKVKVSLDVSGITNMEELATAVNTAIQSAGNQTTTAALNLKSANIVAGVYTDSATGDKSLTFTSASTAFQVEAGNKMGNALLGNLRPAGGGAYEGIQMTTEVAGAAVIDNTGGNVSNSAGIKVRITGGGLGSAVEITASAGLTAGQALADDIRTQVNANAALQAAGITSTSTGTLKFANSHGETFDVQVTGDANGAIGFGAYQAGATPVSDYTTYSGTYDNTVAASANGSYKIGFSVNGAATSGTEEVTVDLTQGDATQTKVTYAASVTTTGAGNIFIAKDGTNGGAIAIASGDTMAMVAGKINAAAQGVTASVDSSGKLILTHDTKGVHTVALGAGTDATIAGNIGAGTTVAGAGRSGQDIAEALTSAFNASSSLSPAGLKATYSGGSITISSTNGTNFRLNGKQTAGTANLGFGTTEATWTGVVRSGGTGYNKTSDANGTSNTEGLVFNAMKFGSDTQSITISANDSTGTQQAKSITLSNNGSTHTGRTIDEAVSYINSQLQGSNNTTLQKIVAVKDMDGAGVEKINFVSSLTSFAVAIGAQGANGNGFAAGSTTGTTVASKSLGSGGSMSIDSESKATMAVTSVNNALAALGVAQAAVGKGQNQLNYAIGLAQSQINNFSAAESRIRDTDVASEAANLTKAQVLQQASIAAMAQANSAPQAVLSLLRG